MSTSWQGTAADAPNVQGTYPGDTANGADIIQYDCVVSTNNHWIQGLFLEVRAVYQTSSR